MDVLVPILAAAYLGLQLGALFWATPTWRRFGHLPIWGFGAATLILVVGGAFGATIAPALMLLSLPCMTFYLAVLWGLYLLTGPGRIALRA